jgi:5-hydroxyisourate hydrolase-like protein (transthyretin family)
VVADENRGVIRRVKVTLRKTKGNGLEDVASVETNNVGRFDFSSIAAGKYRLVFRSREFCFADVPVEVLSKGWDAFWLTMSVAAMDSRESCDDKYRAEELNESSFSTDKSEK